MQPHYRATLLHLAAVTLNTLVTFWWEPETLVPLTCGYESSITLSHLSVQLINPVPLCFSFNYLLLLNKRIIWKYQILLVFIQFCFCSGIPSCIVYKQLVTSAWILPQLGSSHNNGINIIYCRNMKYLSGLIGLNL